MPPHNHEQIVSTLRSEYPQSHILYDSAYLERTVKRKAPEHLYTFLKEACEWFNEHVPESAKYVLSQQAWSCFELSITKEYQPVLHVSSKAYAQMKWNNLQRQNIITGLMEVIRSSLLRAYEFSDINTQAVVVVDAAQVPKTVVSDMKLLINTARKVFPGMIEKVVVVNYHWMHAGAWQMLKGYLSSKAQSRIVFSTANLYEHNHKVTLKEIQEELWMRKPLPAKKENFYDAENSVTPEAFDAALKRINYLEMQLRNIQKRNKGSIFEYKWIINWWDRWISRWRSGGLGRWLILVFAGRQVLAAAIRQILTGKNELFYIS